VNSAQGEVAVVTGGARGFGLEIARRLVARGYTVLITDVDSVAVDKAAAELGPRAHPVVADARDPEDHRAVAAAAAELGRLTAWVNNAGIARTGKAWEHDDADVRLTVETNLLGVLFGSNAAIDAMRGHGGHILNIASMAAFGPVPGLAVYAATKAGVLNFSTSLQGDLDLAGAQIRVHVCCPDAADTKLVRDVQGDENSSILFSGGGLLDPGAVADRAVAMLDGRRIVRAMPGHRAAMARIGAFAPTVALRLLGLLRRVGDRRRRAQAR
jgi:NAD(P)-dependent dehydrogenase (short-subunit alcohol dehydrogenase family)